MSTDDYLERLTHVVYELVDVLDGSGVSPRSRAGAVDLQARLDLAEVKLELSNLLEDLRAGRSAER